MVEKLCTTMFWNNTWCSYRGKAMYLQEVWIHEHTKWQSQDAHAIGILSLVCHIEGMVKGFHPKHIKKVRQHSLSFPPLCIFKCIFKWPACLTFLQCALSNHNVSLYYCIVKGSIGRAWPDGHMAINGHFYHIWPFIAIWPSIIMRLIVASGVSLKRTIQM